MTSVTGRKYKTARVRAKKNRGARGDSLLILASEEALSKKPPLQNRRFKWWEYVTGCGKTTFVMLQGIIGAFGVRIPVSWIMSRQAQATLFQIGLATPASSLVQIVLCGCYFYFLMRKIRKFSMQPVGV